MHNALSPAFPERRRRIWGRPSAGVFATDPPLGQGTLENEGSELKRNRPDPPSSDLTAYVH